MKFRRISSLIFASILGAVTVFGNGMLANVLANDRIMADNSILANSNEIIKAPKVEVSENAISADSAEYAVEAFQINSTEDFIEFADSCRKNSWSKNRVVNLNQDIDLKGVEFTEIPSFSGYFNGNGHTISNLNITEGDEAMGLFRYLEKDGNVSDLTVDGYIASTDSRDLVGGIVGVNSGTILNCKFIGKIRGANVSGGIVGLNGGTGRIIQCENQGFITSQSNVGGIVGINRGFISDCVNNGNVNSDSSWIDDPVEETVDVSNINTVNDVLSSGKNIGGICGWSNGIIASSINNGIVGYLKTGENVGGVAGCHCGSIFYCKNNGKVFGKQDVGGIVGQFEPTIVIKDIQEIKAEVDKLHDILNSSTEDMDKATDVLTSDMDKINLDTDSISNITNKVSDEGLDNIEKNIDVANDFSKRTDYVTNHLSPINTEISSALKDLDKINSIMDKMSDDKNMSQADKDKIKDYRDKIDKRSEEMRGYATNAKNNLEEAEKLLDKDNPSLSENKASKDKIVDAMKDLTDVAVAAADIGGYIGDVYDVVGPYMDDTSDALSKDMDDLTETADNMLNSVTNANDLTGSVLDYLNSLDKLEIINFTSDFDNNIKNLQNEVDTTLDSMDRLNKDASKHSDVLEEDIKKINDQSQIVTDLVIDRISNFEAATNGENIIVDVSMNDKSGELSASITGCTNKGNIDGTSNIGGIIGNISIDSSDDNKKGIGSKYEVSAVVLDNSNSGFVTVKNKNAGGIAGNVVAGYIANCVANGGVISDEGNYIGGIAGNCQGYIENCKSRAVLAGGEYIGGIAGVADDVMNCYSMPMIRDSLGRTGAIIGAYQSDDDDITVYHQGMSDHIFNNYFVSDLLFGIDSVSYTGVAEPIEYEELISKITGFDTCKVYFVDEEYNLINEMQYRYGYDLGKLKYPDVYTDSKTYAEWDKADSDKLTSNLVLRSVVVDNVTIIASEEAKEGKSLAFAEGIFTKEAKLKATKIYDNGFGVQSLSENQIAVVSELPEGMELPTVPANASVIVYEISLENASLSENQPVNIRVLQECEGKATIYLATSSATENASVSSENITTSDNSVMGEIDDKLIIENIGSFQKVDAINIGSYWQVEIIGDKAYVCVVTIPNDNMLIYCIAGVLAVILVIVIGVIVKKKKK